MAYTIRQRHLKEEGSPSLSTTLLGSYRDHTGHILGTTAFDPYQSLGGVLQDMDPNNTVNIGGARCLFCWNTTQARTDPAMPTMLYKVLGENAHACRCTICEPDVSKKFLAQATDFLRAQEIKHLEDEVVKGLRVQALQDLRPAAYAQARKDVNEATLRELIDEKAKDEKRRIRDEATPSRSKGA